MSCTFGALLLYIRQATRCQAVPCQTKAVTENTLFNRHHPIWWHQIKYYSKLYSVTNLSFSSHYKCNTLLKCSGAFLSLLYAVHGIFNTVHWIITFNQKSSQVWLTVSCFSILIKFIIRGVFKKRPNFLNSVPTST